MSCFCKMILAMSRTMVLRAYQSEETKEMLLDLVKRLVEQTDNEIDNMMVEQLEIALRLDKPKVE